MDEELTNIQFGYLLCSIMDIAGVSHWWIDTFGSWKFAFMRNQAPHWTDMFDWFANERA